MVKATVVVVVWDKVVGATGYSILKDDVPVSSTKTATTARLPVETGYHVFTIRALGVSAPDQSVTLTQGQVTL